MGNENSNEKVCIIYVYDKEKMNSRIRTGDLSYMYPMFLPLLLLRFCRTCGILPWYRPRSNPDGYGITLKCVDWGEEEDIRPRIEIKMFDGRNWEKHFAHSGISNCSKN